MPPNIDVIWCVDALCRYYKGILNIRGTALQNELIGIRDNLPTDIRYIRTYTPTCNSKWRSNRKCL